MARGGVVLSVGSINLDLQVRAEHWPSQSETLVAGDFLRAGGGKGANVALVAARLGARASLAGRVGDDPLADLALEGLRARGVDLTHVRRVPHAATAVSMIVVRPDGDKTIVLAANANEQWEDAAERDVAAWVSEADRRAVLVADVEVPVRIALAAMRAARHRGLPAVLDPSPAAAARDLLGLADYVTPNPAEAERLTGIRVRGVEDAITAARRLVDAGARHACVKLPGGGAVLVGDGGGDVVDAPDVQVVDKTGAGDAFAGALATALAEGRDDVEAVRFAVAAATFAVTRWGSQAAYPAREELEPLAGAALAHVNDP